MTIFNLYFVGRDTVHTHQSAVSFSTTAASFPYSGAFPASKTSSESADGFLLHNNQVRFNQHAKPTGPDLRYNQQNDPRTRKVRSCGISSPSVRILRHKQLKKETKSSPCMEILEHRLLRPSVVSKIEHAVNLKKVRIFMWYKL
jgi:hypothetical protein